MEFPKLVDTICMGLYILCFIDVSKIDENRCKQTLSSLPCFGAYR